MKMFPKTPAEATSPTMNIFAKDLQQFNEALQHFIKTIDINAENIEKGVEQALTNFLQAIHHEYVGNAIGTSAVSKNTDLNIFWDAGTKKQRTAVLIEAKKVTNTRELGSKDNLNAKALQELVRYYAIERASGNTDIQHLIITNGYEWFILNAQDVERRLYKPLKKDFEKWNKGQKVNTTTDLFYKIVKEYIEESAEELPFIYLDVRDLKGGADKKVRHFAKILDPRFLLGLGFEDDSNKLNDGFYQELLHIIGLQERKEGSKKLIERKKQGEREYGSLLENTIDILESSGKYRNIQNIGSYGKTRDEQLENIALELSITWVNRLLFLKLLEAQLLRYHDDDTTYQFLNSEMLSDYDAVYKLFFRVLAVLPDNRRYDIQEKFAQVPYLNSSLFEATPLEQQCISINGLDDNVKLLLYKKTVLSSKKEQQEQLPTNRQGLNPLEYFFSFLNAYDFAAEGKGDIKQDTKDVINASVLGLIFEKINGYKDGSFFTPGFITMYMCRETLRRAVVQKFNDTKGWNCKSFDALKLQLASWRQSEDLTAAQLEANQIFNSLRICDPAVGSGHFLVSALNELIAIKGELQILLTEYNENAETIVDHVFEVKNDRLVVRNPHNKEVYTYRPNGTIQNTRIQKAIFQEKQTLIENCLFGVDINPNSVKICRLRLWIELLKHAYYKADGQLETLPNIDINIKTGNSLISRFSLDDEIKSILKKQKITIQQYKDAVKKYHRATNKEDKWEMERLIASIKENFRQGIGQTSRDYRSYVREAKKYHEKYETTSLFEVKLNKKQREDKAKLKKNVDKLKAKVDDLKNNVIYRNAFEWRFEFPEVLNEDGDFIGFDVVIGNPPYLQMQKIKEMSKAYKTLGYATYQSMGDLYALFYEKGEGILRTNGLLSFITGSAWMRANYGKSLRNFFLEKVAVNELIDLSDCDIFDSATVLTNIMFFEKTAQTKPVKAIRFTKKEQSRLEKLKEVFENEHVEIDNFSENSWIISNKKTFKIKRKVEEQGIKLKDWNIEINRGVLTGFNQAFIIDKAKRDELIQKDAKSEEIIKPILRGRDIQKYQVDFQNLYLIGTFPSLELEINNYPAIRDYLKSFGKRLEQVGEKGTRKKTSGEWFETQDSITYWENFERQKIIYPNMTKFMPFAIDIENSYYHNDKAFHLITERLYWLVSFFNSKLFRFCFAENFPELQGNSKELRKVIFEQISVKQLTEAEEQPFKEKVQTILNKKQTDPKADTSDLEAEIDQLVYQLYGLTAEEIAIVEAG